MSDDNDKTVFIQPGNMPPNGKQDKTVVMPNPAIPNPSSPNPSMPTPGIPNPSAPNNPTIAPNLAPGFLPESAEPLNIQNGLNPIVAAASVLLAVSHRLKSTLEHKDIAGLQRQLITEIQQFEQSIKNKQLPQEQILSSRYLLCTMLDEVVLNTPWGATSRWGQHSLLCKFHNETRGGEKCFALLQRMLEAPQQHLDVLELFYLCINLGFQGKFRLDARGQEHLAHIHNTLYETIRNYRGDFPPDLSPNWSSQAVQQQSLMQYFPLWVVGACAALLLLLVFAGFRLWLYQTTEPTVEQLNTLITQQTQTDKTNNQQDR